MVKQLENTRCAKQQLHEEVLVVEDERSSRNAMTMLLMASGYRPHAYRTAEDALSAVSDGHLPRVALVDLDLPGMNGLELIDRLEKADPAVYPILITATDEDTLATRLMERPVAYLRKPINFDVLLGMLADQRHRH